MDDVGRKIDVQQGRVRRKRAGVLVLITVGRYEVWAIGRAIDGYFAAGAAADGADRFALCGAEPRAFSFLTDRTGQRSSVIVKRVQQHTLSANRIKPELPARRVGMPAAQRHPSPCLTPI